MEAGNKFLNSELIRGIKNGNRIVLEYLYDTVLQQFKIMVSKEGGQPDDAFEIFQKVLTGIYLKLQNNELRIEKNPEAYILVSCKRQYIKKRSGNQSKSFIQVDENLDVEIVKGQQEDELLKEKYKLLWECLKDLSERCRKIISLYFNGYSSEEITEEVGLKTASYVRRVKAECMDKLKSKYFTRYKNA